MIELQLTAVDFENNYENLNSEPLSERSKERFADFLSIKKDELIKELRYQLKSEINCSVELERRLIIAYESRQSLRKECKILRNKIKELTML
jgi:hypothetical protein